MDLEPIKERLAEATPGPWESQGFDNYPGDEGTPIIGTSGIGLVAYALRHNVNSSNNRVDWYDEEQCDKDAEFIAHAPEDIASLIAEVERLRERERAFSKSLGFGDGITEPVASLDNMLTPILEAFDTQREHAECPTICEGCGEYLARLCRYCFGAGFCARLEKNKWTPFECDHCKGLGSVHEGCVGKSYATLVEELNKLKGES